MSDEEKLKENLTDKKSPEQKVSDNTFNKKVVLFLSIVILVIVLVSGAGYYVLYGSTKTSDKKINENDTNVNKDNSESQKDKFVFPKYVIDKTYVFDKPNGRLLGDVVIFRQKKGDRTLGFEAYSLDNKLLFKYDNEYEEVYLENNINLFEVKIDYNTSVYLDMKGKEVDRYKYEYDTESDPIILENETLFKDVVIREFSENDFSWYNVYDGDKLIAENLVNYKMFGDKLVLLYDKDIKVYDATKKEFTNEKVRIDTNRYLDYTSCKNGTKLFDQNGKVVSDVCALYYEKYIGKYYLSSDYPYPDFWGSQYNLYRDGKLLEREIYILNYMDGSEDVVTATDPTEDGIKRYSWSSYKKEKVLSFDQIDYNRYIGMNYNGWDKEYYFYDQDFNKISQSFEYIDCDYTKWCVATKNDGKEYLYYNDELIIQTAFDHLDVNYYDEKGIEAWKDSKTYIFKLKKGTTNNLDVIK